MLSKLGLPISIQEDIQLQNIDSENLARVVAVHKERFVIRNTADTFNAEITGNLRYSAISNEDFPAVGDWVEMTAFDENTAIITSLLKRVSSIQRRAVGKYGEAQMIAANVDYCFIVMALDQNFNLNRLDRYVSICEGGAVKPIVLLSKSDLVETELAEDQKQAVLERYSQIDVMHLSALTEDGLQELSERLEEKQTYCFIGSSGVGKSTIVNHLLGSEALKTSALSESNQKGRHTTSHRELFVLPNGSIIIDTPGMRELGMADNSEGIDVTFSQISDLSESCRFSDCTHTSEKGCAILDALEEGEISEDEYDNYQKLQREQEHYAESQKDKRKKGKQLSKMIKQVKSNHRKY